MKTCKTCRWWKPAPDDYRDRDREHTVMLGEDLRGLYWAGPDEEPLPTAELEALSVAQHGYLVRECEAPKILFYQRPDRTGAAVVDGSGYRAALVTAEDFGCVLWEGK